MYFYCCISVCSDDDDDSLDDLSSSSTSFGLGLSVKAAIPCIITISFI